MGDSPSTMDGPSLLAQCGYRNVVAVDEWEHVQAAISGFQPELLVLEANESTIHRLELLKAMTYPEASATSLVVFAADDNPATKRQAFKSGALDYFPRPVDVLELLRRMATVVRLQKLEARLHRRKDRFDGEIHEATMAAERTQMEMLTRLAHLMDRRSTWLGSHNWRVARLSGELALALGKTREYADNLMRASRLHDVGKLALPEYILENPKSLTCEERKLLESHTLAGAHLLSGGTSSLLRLAESVALSHHENWDGSGYPHGLKGEEIPVEGRIVAVANAFDSLTTPRPGYKPIPAAEALSKLQAASGTKYDPSVLSALASTQALKSSATRIMSTYTESPGYAEHA